MRSKTTPRRASGAEERQQPMSTIIIGGPIRGKTTLAKMMSGTSGDRHLCTDPQRFCHGYMGTPDRLGYDDVSQWVADNWMSLQGVIIEGVHAARALQKALDSGIPVAATRVVYLIQEMEQRMRPGQKGQATKVSNQLAELKPRIESMLELWAPDGKGGFAEVPRCALVTHTPAPVQYKKKSASRYR